MEHISMMVKRKKEIQQRIDIFVHILFFFFVLSKIIDNDPYFFLFFHIAFASCEEKNLHIYYIKLTCRYISMPSNKLKLENGSVINSTTQCSFTLNNISCFFCFSFYQAAINFFRLPNIW